MKKLFGGIDMTYKRMILFALGSALYTGIMMVLPFLKDTSFQDIGISYECWVLLAVIVVVNCKSGIDAMIKCFLYFLISQPLIYLVQVLLGTMEMNMAIYYYKLWIIPTILTIPGGFIAYYCKKENWIGAIILGIGNAIILTMGVTYIILVTQMFPRHLLTALFCLVTPFVLTFNIQHKTKYRVVSLVVPVIIVGSFVLYALLNGLSLI